MSDKDKVIEYELQIEDMLHTIRARMEELANAEKLDDFQQGRQLAYFEMMEIIQNRHKMILDVLSED